MPTFPTPAPWSPPLGRPARILIVKLSALGDVVHTLPVLATLRRLVPDAVVEWVVEDRAAATLVGRADLAVVHVFPRRRLAALRARPLAWAREAMRFVGAIRARPYDLVLDLQGNLKSGVITRLSRSRNRWGFAAPASREGNRLFTNRHVRPPPSARHRVQRNLALLSAALGRDAPWTDPGLPISPDAARRATTLLVGAGLPPRRFVLFHPGTSAFGAFKRWPPDRFADLARHLAAAGEAVAVVAAPGEEALADAVVRASDGTAKRVRVDAIGVLGALLARAALVVAADTGPLHLAALAGTPVVGCFGPKDPAVYGPWGRRRDGTVGRLPVALRADVACRPCGRRRCGDPVCMTGLRAQTVLEAAREA